MAWRSALPYVPGPWRLALPDHVRPTGHAPLDLASLKYRDVMIQDIKRFCEARHLPTTVAYIPDRAELLGGDRASQAFAEARDFAGTLGANFLDGREIFEGMSRAEIRAHYLPYNGHWNQGGSNRFAGEVHSGGPASPRRLSGRRDRRRHPRRHAAGPRRRPGGQRAEIMREEIDRRIRRTAPKLKEPVANWLDETRLPALRYRDGDPLGSEATRYLLYRQSRAKEIRPDIEARPLYALIHRTTSGDFALEVFRQFAASKADAKDRWALAIAGLLGDDRLVPILNQMIQTWVNPTAARWPSTPCRPWRCSAPTRP